MAENSAIEWTDHTFNPWEGCQKVGLGCDHCYAETRNARFGGGIAPNWGPGAPRRRTSIANWRKPLAWQAAAAQFFATHGRRQRVFCASLADVFDNAVLERWRQGLFELIEATPDLDWLLLTKRIGNVAAMTDFAWGTQDWPANVWLGATIVNQNEADRDIPKLLGTQGPRRRFLSMEPLLGPVDLTALATFNPNADQNHFYRDVLGKRDHSPDWECPEAWTGHGLDWVIVGGESGPGARPMRPEWVIALRDQCEAADVPFLFKQWGEHLPVWDEGDVVRAPQMTFHRVGKKAAGRRLHGVTHDGVPA